MTKSHWGRSGCNNLTPAPLVLRVTGGICPEWTFYELLSGRLDLGYVEEALSDTLAWMTYVGLRMQPIRGCQNFCV
jgi:hypothetical protein